MSLNEAGAARSNLTRRERQEALAAIYGLPAEPSEAEIEKIRRRLAGDEDQPNE
jgi:hypothetical protein